MKLAGKTDVGLVRQDNQDDYRAGQLPGDAAWALVCDGMGGVAGGSIASSVAVETYIRTLSDSDHPDQAVHTAVMAANSAIRQRAAGHPELRSMGTTLVSALVKGDRVLISNVGDSRAYYLSDDGIRQISRDHSYVEELVSMGAITREEAAHHPKKNIITRALGVDASVEADYFECPLHRGDGILLCSDGLSNMVSDKEIHDHFKENALPEDVCSKLMALALARGARDNVSIVLIKT